MRKEVKLPSGLGTLRIQVSPFADSKELFQVVLREMKGAPSTDFGRAFMYTCLSSSAIEHPLKTCMTRCTVDYKGAEQKIDKDTFEQEDYRQDYVPACLEIIEANVLPFLKSLSAGWQPSFLMDEKSPA